MSRLPRFLCLRDKSAATAHLQSYQILCNSGYSTKKEQYAAQNVTYTRMNTGRIIERLTGSLFSQSFA
jgi:hypothetical protein